MGDIIAYNELAGKIRQLLERKECKLVIGYRAKREVVVSPFLLKEPELAEQLVWNTRCIFNLATYLTREPAKQSKRVAIMAKPCDLRAINVLIQENQAKREDLFIIGLQCKGVTYDRTDPGEMALKCISCPDRDRESNVLGMADLIVHDQEGTVPKCENDKINEMLEKLAGMDQKSRWRFWQEEFKKCIRCYACRLICPACYCERCVAEMSQPQWIEKSAHLKGNFIYHLTRAFHMSGRCVGCGECMRACPMHIPLLVLYKGMNQKVKELFDYIPGNDSDQEPVLSQFGLDDEDSFIK
ncbi:MAG: 4Fe-4S binding protein [bacterium]